MDPFTTDEGGDARSRSQQQLEPAERARILVLDDDTAVGRAIERALHPLKAIFVQSAAGALGRIGAGGQFAAIVSDMRMPGMSGIQFHDEVERIDSALARRIVYVTAAGETPDFAKFVERTGCRWLPKPFAPDQLRELVRTTLASSS